MKIIQCLGNFYKDLHLIYIIKTVNKKGITENYKIKRTYSCHTQVVKNNEYAQK